VLARGLIAFRGYGARMPAGGFREGAGKIPTDLDAPIDYRPVKQPDGSITQVPVSYMDRIIEAISLGGFIHDAAARVGVSVETLRDWRRQGVKALADVAQGTKRASHLSRKVRQYAELATRMERAEAEARLRLLGLGQQMAQGGMRRTETTTKTIEAQGGQPTLVERTTREIEEPPSTQMITWLLARRWPADYGTARTELTGPGGTPLPDPTNALDRLRTAIETAKTSTNGHQPTTT
jgi:transposase-like protein